MTRRRAPVELLLAGVLAPVLLVGCSGVELGSSDGAARPKLAPAVPTTAPSEPGRSSPSESGRGTPSESPTAARDTSGLRAAREPRLSHLSIPAIGLGSVPVLRYTGTPDDAEGTRIQNRGPTASPRGPGGGVGSGEVGNFIVTGHRTSHSAPFRDLPALRTGDRVRVRSGRTVYV
ncbi:MAG: sortase domain-containing protein, partial [Nocardioidaceae bacterium]